jgi:recombination protein RecA
MGHNGKKHLAVEVETCEMGFKVIQDCTAQFKSSFGAKLPIIFVWDTLAATPTQDEKSGDEYASGMTYKPRLIRAELRKITPELKKINASIVFVNQTIENVKGHNKGGVKTTPGGGGVKFWASQRLQVEKVGVFQDAEDKKKELGIISQVKVVKNKFAAPNKKADLPLRYDVGIDPIREVCNYLNDNTNVYNTAGAYKKIVGFTDDDISFYERDIDKVLAKHPGLFDYLKENAINHWLTGKTLIE